MILTKHQHACFTLEKEGKLLVVDPGELTQDLGAPENVVGIVITHAHADHFDASALGALIAHNPLAIIYAHEAVTAQLGDTLPTQVVRAGETIDVSPFSVTFYGGTHAPIHPDIPVVANLGLFVDELLYYPGDSFITPGRPVAALALPVSAPWLKIADAIDFARDINAGLVFPTHDAILSEAGKAIVDRVISAQIPDSRYARLYEPVEVQ